MATLKRQLRAVTARQLAKGLGVSERTARRYRDTGKISPSKLKAFEAWKVEHKAPTRKGERRLLQLPTADLAAFAGVSRRAARQWQEKGKIPERRLAEFLTIVKPTPLPRVLRRGKKTTFEGRLTHGEAFQTEVNAELSKGLVAQIASWGSRLPYSKRRGRNVQFVAEVESTLALDEALPGKAYVKGLEKSPDGTQQFGKHTIVSHAYRDKSKGLADFLNELRGALDFDVRVVSVSAVIREHW